MSASQEPRDACQFCGDPVDCDGRCEGPVEAQRDYVKEAILVAVKQRIRELEDARKARQSVVRESDQWLEDAVKAIQTVQMLAYGPERSEP